MPRCPLPQRLLRDALIVAALLLATQPCSATNIRVAAQEGTEPKFQAEAAAMTKAAARGQPPGGAVVGICIDIIHAIERIDPGLTFVGDQNWQPLARIYSELASGIQDAACGFQHINNREEKFTLIGPPLLKVDYVLVARADDPVVINSWDDVRKLGPKGVVLSNRGFAVSTMLEQKGGLLIDATAGSPQLNLQKLIAGRGRFFYHRSRGLQRFLDQSGLAPKVRVLPRIMSSNELYFVVGLHVDHSITERLQRALEQLDKSGELERIGKRWN